MASASMERALKLAVVTGLRAALGPALIARAQHRPEQQHLAAAALGELVFDKLPFVPGRDTLPSLIARGLAGAWVAGKCAEEDGADADPWAAPLGAAVAIGVAVVAPKVRRSLGWTLGIPQPVLGLIEDYLALRLGTEAVGLSMDEVTHAAMETVDDLRERFQLDGVTIPGLPIGHPQSAGAGSM
jgi:uncharacterized membrane protein